MAEQAQTTTQQRKQSAAERTGGTPAGQGRERPPILDETVRLPEMVSMPAQYARALGRPPETTRYLEPGLYDVHGRKVGGLREASPRARTVIEFAGVTFVWGAFSRPLEPGEEGWLTFLNVPGTMPITPFFSEWDAKRSEPKLGDALLPLLSSQRGRDVARVVGRNDGAKRVLAAAGFIVSQDLDLPPSG